MRDLKYDFAAIEPKWQKKWQETGVYQTGNHSDKPKFYALVEFPYPSGQGLHVGHARPYTAMDVVARKRRMDGYNVLFPMGYDAFGLPTENYAIKNHIHPAKVTHDNIENFRRQLQMLGYSFDWSREVNTTDPSYYKWTQWIFLQLYKHGLAYKTTMPVNWCTSCKCVLANEEVVEGVCERCGSPVIRKEKSQWMLKITEYAQRLIDDLDGLDFIERVKTQQKNWIGRSTGAEVTFQATTGDAIVVYTTRPDTLFGATYMVLSPEHELVRKWLEGGALKNAAEVTAYQKAAASKSDLERTELNKEKTGVRLDGVRGVNPVNGREIPIFISDYVLSTYGTGAIMAVPAHDDRDWEFAKKFGCEIIEVVSGGEDVQQAAFTAKDDTGILVNSDFLNGKTVKDAIPAMIQWLEEKGIGRPSTYAPTISTILDREYVVKEGKNLRPTPLGEVVTGLMKDKFTDIVDTAFTATMEERLDEVETGKVDWKSLLGDFYGDFEQELQKAEADLDGERIKVPDEVSDVICPKCGRNLVYKSGRFGRFLACPGWPECDHTQPIVIEMPGKCPKCGGKILKKTSKRGYAYYGCENNSSKDEAKRCDFMTWDVPVKETCPECGHTLFKKSGRGFKKPFCINPECPNFLPEDQRGYKKKAASAESPAEGAPPEEEKKPAQKAAAKKTAAKKPAAKTAAAKKTAAPKKTAAKKPTAKKAAAKTKSEA